MSLEDYRNKDTFKVIGACIEVHNSLGPGLLEIVYKDALEIEFKERGISFEREKEFKIEYKGIVLPHKFYADFIVFEDIILEIKSVTEISKEHLAQTLNYIKLSNADVGLIVNFNKASLERKRLVSTK